MRLLRRPPRARRLALALVLFGAAFGSIGARTLFARRASETPAHREVVRIQAHFDSVLNELSSSSTPNDGRASARRVALVRTLRAYRDAGVFPHNYDFPGRTMPYFVDRGTGTLCAVAHLLASTGRRDIVDRVARTNNNVWVADLAGDTAFTRWLDVNGISLAEAARIQVPYMETSTGAQVARQNAFMVIAPAAFGTATVTAMMNAMGNADGHSRTTRILGISAGALTVGAGTLLLAKGAAETPKIGAGAIAVGGLSIALASRATHRHGAIVARQREAERARSVQASLSPMVGPGGSGGISLAIRY
jgi:hypothetical protein